MTISFDIWGTLVKASPVFSKAKIELVKSVVGNIASETEIKESFNKIKKYHDGLVEMYGNQPDNYTLFSELFNEVGIMNVDIDAFITRYLDLFLQHPPSLFPGTKLVLDNLHSKGHELIISSNTLFINGATLKSVLETLGVAKYFSEFRFSDEVKRSKPHGEMFNWSADFHIGDNKVTDGACTGFDIRYYQINSNEKTIIDFYEEIILSSTNK